MFSDLRPKTTYALISFCIAKFFGFMAIPAMFFGFKTGVAVGSLWGVFIIASMVFSVLSWRDGKEDRERIQYEKLKAKYGSVS